MGIYLNPGNKGFWQSVRSEIYVDKTGLIACTNKVINTEEQCVCVSRPRNCAEITCATCAGYFFEGAGQKT